MFVRWSGTLWHKKRPVEGRFFAFKGARTDCGGSAIGGGEHIVQKKYLLKWYAPLEEILPDVLSVKRVCRLVKIPLKAHSGHNSKPRLNKVIRQLNLAAYAKANLLHAGDLV